MSAPNRHIFAAVSLAASLVFASPSRAGDGGVTSAEIRGVFSTREALVRVARGKVELSGTARIESGVPVGVSRFEEVHCTLEVKNALDRAVHDVQVELAFAREATGGGKARLGKPGSDDEAADQQPTDAPPAYPISGWTFHYTLDEIAPGATAALPCKSALPPSDRADAPSSFAELTFAVEVTGYRAERLSLAKAMEMVRRGSPADQHAAFRGYGDGLSDEARAKDEQALVALLSQAVPEVFAPPARSQDHHHAHDGAAARADKPGKPDDGTTEALQFAFLLAAARRIGGEPTLFALLVAEEMLAARAPALPEKKDDGKGPSPSADLLPETFAAAVHETLVDVAHENLAALYLLLHPAAAPPAEPTPAPKDRHGRARHEPRQHDRQTNDDAKLAVAQAALIMAANQFADEEELDAPESWMEAAAGEQPAEGGKRRATGVQIALIEALGLRGGPEVMPALASALKSDDETLRGAAAKALAKRGEPGIAALADALDTEDRTRRKAAEMALVGLDGADFEAFGKLVRARGAAVSDDATATDLIAALDAKLAGDRAREVATLLDQADDADPLSPQPLALLAQAKARSKTAYEASREHLARIAAHLYVARAAAHRADARVLLDEVAALGPVRDESFRAAFRDARIAEARALADKDLDRALAILGEKPIASGARQGFDDKSDPVLAEAARSLLVARLDDALNHRETKTAGVLLLRARRDGGSERELSPREHRLRLLRLALPLAIAGVVLLLVIGVSVPLMLRRKRRRAAE